MSDTTALATNGCMHSMKWRIFSSSLQTVSRKETQNIVTKFN